MVRETCSSADAYRLFLEGQEALSQVESNGIRIDTEYLERTWSETADVLDQKTQELKSGEIWDAWIRVYGESANVDSGQQLGHIIFDVFKVPCEFRTPSGAPSVDEDALERVKFPWIRKFVSRKKLFTARNTFLAGIRREVVGGFLHPDFSLTRVVSFRSSSSKPNSQNFPNRIDRTARMVRQAIIPRGDDYEIAEFDLKGAEVCVSACYHQDPTMIGYLQHGHDYHKDLACQCFKLKPDQVTKIVRGEAKTDFVFASFYGSWWKNIARKMWDAIDLDDLRRVDGVGLKQHLVEQGIRELGGDERKPKPGTFEAHIADVYDDFWNRRFLGYTEWKNEWWSRYLKNGYFQSHTGFLYTGIMNRREATNYPIQGSSFHCLLWVLIELQKWLNQYQMKSKIIGQIHDSILMDIHKSEFDAVSEKVAYLIRVAIRKVWPWVILPLDVEAAKSDRDWYSKKEFELPKITVI